MTHKGTVTLEAARRSGESGAVVDAMDTERSNELWEAIADENNKGR
jgi:hypothetical protein